MDVEKTMQFILEQQAQFSVQMNQLTEKQNAHADQLSSLEKDVQIIAGATKVLIQARDEDRLRLNAFEEKMELLSDKVNQTTDNVNALIKVVDGLVRREYGHL